MAGVCFWSQISRNFGPKSCKARPATKNLPLKTLALEAIGLGPDSRL